MIDTQDALDILDILDFTQIQRAGRELWAIKSTEFQDEDVRRFSSVIQILKKHLNSQQDKIYSLQKELYDMKTLLDSKQTTINELEKGTIEYEV